MASLLSIAEQLGNLSVTVASGDALDVRQFTVHERMSSLFTVSLLVVSESHDVDFDTVVGQPARFSLQMGPHERSWTGLCNRLQQVGVEELGPEGRALSTYQLSVVPTLWLATQRRNHRMFQQQSELDIVLKLLGEWGIKPVEKLSGKYKKRKYRVQYAESDFSFMSRMLEDAGISFYFEQHGAETKLVLSDAPQGGAPRPAKIPFRDNPSAGAGDHVTAVRLGQQVRPGRYTLRDHDYRLPATYPLLAGAEGGGGGIEQRLEQFHYTPGAFLFGTDKGEDSPFADDRGKTRTDEGEAKAVAQKRLDAKRGTARVCTFETNALDLAPGVVMSMLDHPRKELGEGEKLLIVDATLSGTPKSVAHACEARSAAFAYRPALETPKPKVSGVESATVVGPKGEEIHTDEFGRVRVHFHWDRESVMDEKSSCWIHVSQPWGGSGYGGSNLPRIGQEVLVDFLGGDPDRPVIVGRMYTNLQKTPYKLPENKTQSGWKSNSTGGGGGFNELMFEDAVGQELLRMQAEKDLHKLVKNDEQSTVGRDRTRKVKRNESVTVGGNRTKRVKLNEQQVIGLNQSVTVGVNRSTQVGAIDSTIVGNTHSVMVSPPGELWGGGATSITVKHRKIVLSTGAGATITLQGAKITLSAAMLTLKGTKHTFIRGKSGVNIESSKGKVSVKGKKGVIVRASAGDIDMRSDLQVKISGRNSTELTSSGPTTVNGTPVQLNGPGLFAGRVTELAPATITTGAALVLVGGPSFPLPVVKQADGSLKIGDHIVVQPGTGRYGDFQSKVMRDLGIMSSTPSGLQRLNNIQNNPGGHNINIREYSAAEAANPKWGPNNSLTYGSNGSGSEIAYNPDIVVGPNGHPEPPDATLFHEMGHAEHNAYGTNRGGESMGGGWDNREEWQNIEGGINQPGGSDFPGTPQSPAENDYLGDRNYPYQRTDHGAGYSNADGTPIAP